MTPRKYPNEQHRFPLSEHPDVLVPQALLGWLQKHSLEYLMYSFLSEYAGMIGAVALARALAALSRQSQHVAG